jgi:hypothetical protein
VNTSTAYSARVLSLYHYKAFLLLIRDMVEAVNYSATSIDAMTAYPC